MSSTIYRIPLGRKGRNFVSVEKIDTAPPSAKLISYVESAVLFVTLKTMDTTHDPSHVKKGKGRGRETAQVRQSTAFTQI